MGAISILNEVKNKVLNAEYYDLLKRAYDLQNENIEQLKSIIENLKKNHFLLDEYVFSRPLEKIVHSFMEVLLPCFVLERTNKGYSLSVQFDEKSEAIWTREARTKLRSRMETSVVKRYKYNFNKFMDGNWSEEFSFTQEDYPRLKFRYASGGTLPIIKLEGKDYYCLFYRDIPPVGWNIANGACDTLVELLYPIDTIERELREEMIIIKPGNNKKTDESIRYVFPLDKDKSKDHPDFAVARKLWKRYLPGISDFKIDEKHIKWEKGPDKVNIQTLLPHVADSTPKCN
ncbi:MAG: hypothetical protein ISS76_21820 [Phycisphaerae bacterium]|nr:hypothetical protein [Phycisphaerae bacterium]